MVDACAKHAIWPKEVRRDGRDRIREMRQFRLFADRPGKGLGVGADARGDENKQCRELPDARFRDDRRTLNRKGAFRSQMRRTNHKTGGADGAKNGSGRRRRSCASLHTRRREAVSTEITEMEMENPKWRAASVT